LGYLRFINWRRLPLMVEKYSKLRIANFA
jgi:hypothetical protein